MEHKSVRRDHDVHKLIDRTIVRLWETIEELEALTPAEYQYYRVAIFGSARVQPGDQLYEDVRSLARRLSEMGCDIVTGGGPGLMEAGNVGAKGGGNRSTRSIGLTITIPSEQGPNAYLDRVTAHRTFFSRLHHFVRMSHAFVIFPGGIGTALETFMIWQLCQVGFIADRPLVFVGEMWDGLIEWMRRDMLSRRLIDEPDLALARRVDSIEDALAIISENKADFDGRREARLESRRESAASPTRTG
jgi:uncharacterized protein (TIGR00730 family)